MWVTSDAARTARISSCNGGTPSKRRSPTPRVTGAMWVRSSSIRPAARYWLTVAAPPAMATSRSPAAVRAWSKGGAEAVGDEPEGGAALHRQRRAGVVGEHEHGGVVGRVLAPPAPPAEIPVVADRSEHVAAHHERPSSHDPVDLGLVLIGGVEHPGVQPVHRSVAERLVGRLARTGEVAVGRDREVAEDRVTHGAQSSSQLLASRNPTRAASRIDQAAA